MQENRYDPEMINRLKKEVIRDLKARREWQEEYYGDPEEYDGEYEGRPPGPGYGMGYGRPGPGYARGYGRRGPGYGPGMGPGRAYGWCPRPGSMPGYRNRRPPMFDSDWWTDREVYDNQRNMMMLRKQLQQELNSINKISSRMGQIRDPQVRQMLYELLQEAGQQGMDIPEVMDSLNMNNNYNPRGLGGLTDRVSELFTGIDRRSFGLGAGASLLGLLLVPSLSKSLKPMIRKVMEEAMDVTDRAQGVFAKAKEEFEDIVAEANFNKMKESLGSQAAPPDDNKPPTK